MNIKNPLFNANGGFLCLGRVWCGARDGSTAIPPVVARIFSGDSTSPLTREASVMAIFEGLLSFCNCCGNGSIRCNGRSKQGKDALSVCAQGLCKDAKLTKHTQTLTLRKARGIVRFWKGWWSDNPYVLTAEKFSE